MTRNCAANFYKTCCWMQTLHGRTLDTKISAH